MRAFAPELEAALASGASTLCRCWQVVRQDGVTLGFTDHDTDISFDGQLFQARAGLSAGAFQTSTGLSVDNAQAVGALSSDGLTEEDLRAGLYDGATVHYWLVDWRNVAGRALLFTGTIGEIERGPAAFEAELRGLAEALNRPVGRAFLRGCDAALGDGRCKVNVNAPEFRAETTVAAVTVSGAVIVEADSHAETWFEGGRLVWLGGANVAKSGHVKRDRLVAGGRQIELWQPAAQTVAVGDRLALIAGCDKRAETCRLKFSNFMNFRGFPQIPGEDWVTAYPTEGGVHDGGSLRRS
ncbi:MAG: DUF2163 domain-containing protein [Pseudomonadota bacterium]